MARPGAADTAAHDVRVPRTAYRSRTAQDPAHRVRVPRTAYGVVSASHGPAHDAVRAWRAR
ncbi:hypothetical protein [Streptomyces anulatus]|uniref:hypothetical protein n=1 Tax=Streptomyces anulatus TaxID=1892 RepID=UPI0036370F89